MNTRRLSSTVWLALVLTTPAMEVLAARRAEAQAQPLFQDSSPLDITLTSEFNLLNKERNPDSSKQFPGVLTVDGRDIAVTLGSRGHFRLKRTTCDFVPIRVVFTPEQIAETVFAGQTTLKLVTHCQNAREFDQYVMREYLAYTLANLVTPATFRARLVRATYIESQSKKRVSTHSAMFLEHENDVARRLSGRDVPRPQLLFKDLDHVALTTMMLIEYMLGNVDFSIWGLHNVLIVQDQTRRLVPVPHDFDMSGMVHAPYANPDPRLRQRQRSVTDRLYRGPCRTVGEFNTAAEPFRARRADMFQAIDALNGLELTHKREMKDYLESFFRAIETPESIKRTLVDGCYTARTRI